MDKRAFNEKQTAEYLGVSLAFLRADRINGIRKGRTIGPPFIKFGKSVRYLREDIETWIEKHRVVHKEPQLD